jgi:hypothetical protein
VTQPDSDGLEAAWAAVDDALSAGWTVGRTSHHVEAPERAWRVFAIDLRRRANGELLPRYWPQTFGQPIPGDHAEVLRGAAPTRDVRFARGKTITELLQAS